MKIKLNEETVTFRDGTTITLREADWLTTLKIGEVEDAIRIAQAAQVAADPSILDDPEEVKRRNFALFFYPKMSVPCTNGHTPSLEDALAMPATEVMNWYDAAKRVNPDWWASAEETPEEKPSEEEVKKKMARTHKRHRAAKAPAS